MKLSVQLIEPKDVNDWEKSIQITPQYSIFHSMNWANVLINTYHYRPYYLQISQSNKIVAFIPLMEVKNIFQKKNAVSIPFADFCEPIIFSDDTQSSVFKQIFDYGKIKGWHTIEFRGPIHNHFNAKPTLEFFHHSINLLKTEEQLFNSLTKMTQRNIIKSQKCNLRYEISTTFDSVKKYYQIHCITRKNLGVPPQPFSFFVNIFEHILKEKKGFIIFAYHKDIVIAGQIYFVYCKKALFKFGASIKKYQNTKPNNFLIWETIKWLKRNKIEYLSLGRTDLWNEGLRKFKNGWGASETRLFYFTYDLEKESFITSNSQNIHWYFNIFRHFPVTLLKWIGFIAYKYMG